MARRNIEILVGLFVMLGLAGLVFVSLKAANLTNIVEWLNVEQSLRYRPGNGKTFCNIYAYDYCYLAGVYLPRSLVDPKRSPKIGCGRFCLGQIWPDG